MHGFLRGHLVRPVRREPIRCLGPGQSRTGGAEMLQHIADAERGAVSELAAGVGQQIVLLSRIGLHRVRGQCDVRRAESPDVKIVNADDAGKGREELLPGHRVNPRWHGVESEVDRFLSRPHVPNAMSSTAACVGPSGARTCSQPFNAARPQSLWDVYALGII